jgi:predicted transcriptional regulator
MMTFMIQKVRYRAKVAPSAFRDREEGTHLFAKQLLRLGSRATVHQVLSRLVQRGTLLRAGHGIHVQPVQNRIGIRAPSVVKMVEGLANQRWETIVSHVAAADISSRMPHMLERCRAIQQKANAHQPPR